MVFELGGAIVLLEYKLLKNGPGINVTLPSSQVTVEKYPLGEIGEFFACVDKLILV
jgi:hypothetical protein